MLTAKWCGFAGHFACRPCREVMPITQLGDGYAANAPVAGSYKLKIRKKAGQGAGG
jgi:hypothetical protein